MTRFIACITGFAVAWIAAATMLVAVVIPASAEASTPCMEDQPCWNWTTMGNRQRGVTLKGGKRVSVTARQFCRVRIDWKRTAHLRFDPTCNCKGD